MNLPNENFSNNLMNCLSIIGARPHYMKVAPIHREMMKRRLNHHLIHTGQHYDEALTQSYEREFDLPKALVNLNVGSDRPVSQMANIMSGLEKMFDRLRPDLVLVYGDTNSTAAAAISAAKMNIPLAHVEAGLREFRKDVPEEINKLLIDSVADLLFCPTPTAKAQLNDEGKSEGVFFTGDVVYDLVKNSNHSAWRDTILTRKLKQQPFYFVTAHREINTSNKKRLNQIVDAIKKLKFQVVFSVHPRTKKALKHFNLWDKLQLSNIYTVDSRPYWETQWLISNAQMTLTDSGGVSKESFFHGTRCVLLDDQIEWTELVNAGWIQICGANSSRILKAADSFNIPSERPNAFGEGNAAQIIVDEIIKYHAARK